MKYILTCLILSNAYCAIVRSDTPRPCPLYIEKMKKDFSPLQRAAISDDIDLVKELISQGSNGDDEEVSALMCASAVGNVEVVNELIIAGADVNKAAFQVLPWMGFPVLAYAIDSGSSETIAMLIKAGAKVDALVMMKLRGLQPAVCNHPLLTYAIARHAPIDVIELLVKSGANTHNYGIKEVNPCWTPLEFAKYLKNYVDDIIAILEPNEMLQK